MAIHERIYQRLAVRPDKPAPRPMATLGRVLGQHAMRGWRTRLLFYGAFVPGLVFALIIYFLTRNEERVLGLARQFALTEINSFEDVDSEIWYRCGANLVYLLLGHVQVWFALLLTAMVGAPLVSEDLRTQAAEVYLARPMAPRDYVAGKAWVIAQRLFVVLALPTILVLALGNLLIPASFVASLPLYLVVVAFSALVATSNALLMLGVSALTRSARYATAIWFLIYFVSWIVSEVLVGSTDNTVFEFCSWRTNQHIVLSEMLQLEPLHEELLDLPSIEHSMLPSLLILIGCAALASWTVLRRMQPRKV